MGCVVHCICIRNEWGCVMVEVIDMVMYCIAGCTVGHWLGMLVVKCIEHNRKKKANVIRVTINHDELKAKELAQKILKEFDKGKL